MRRAFPALLSAAALVSFAPSAFANGRFPSAGQLAVAPSDPSMLVLRTTFGLVTSRGGSPSWGWICEQGQIDGGYGGPEDPAIGITANGTIVAGLFEGLVQSSDNGCSWQMAGGAVAGQAIVDDVVRPDAPHTVLALTNVFAENDDAGLPRFTSQVFASTDDGAHWSTLGTPLDSSYILETIEVAASDPHRLYVSGLRGSGATSQAVILVSLDDGQTWAVRPIPIDPSFERSPFIAAVDPTNADRVYVRTNGSGASRLFVTSDAGKTFTVAYTASGKLAGFALSPDGSKVYVGGPMDGLLVGDSAGLSFAKKSSIHVQCLRTSGSILYACSDEASGFLLGKSTDDGASFTAMLHLSAGITGPIQCAPGASTSVCASLWPMQAGNLGINLDAGMMPPPGSDGGPPPVPSANPPPPGSSSSGCGCSEAGVPASGALAGLIAAAAAALARMRRRPRR